MLEILSNIWEYLFNNSYAHLALLANNVFSDPTETEWLSNVYIPNYHLKRLIISVISTLIIVAFFTVIYNLKYKKHIESKSLLYIIYSTVLISFFYLEATMVFILLFPILLFMIIYSQDIKNSIKKYIRYSIYITPIYTFIIILLVHFNTLENRLY